MPDPKVWKVYEGREMVAAVKYAEDAAAVVGLGPARTVKCHGRIVFRGPIDEESGVDAADSYDAAAAVMHRRAAGHK